MKIILLVALLALPALSGCDQGQARTMTPSSAELRVEPLPGGCWFDAECPAGQQCEGAVESRTAPRPQRGVCTTVAVARSVPHG